MKPRYSILLVDDDSFIRQIYGEHLEEVGHLVTPARSGAAACELLRSVAPFDVAIVDYAMPDMMGDEVLAAVQDIRPDLPVAFLSGYGEFLDLSGRSRGCPVIPKSPRIAEIIAAVEAVARGEALPQAGTGESRLEQVVRQIATKPAIDRIGRELHDVHDETAKEGLPSTFTSLIAKLKQRVG